MRAWLAEGEKPHWPGKGKQQTPRRRRNRLPAGSPDVVACGGQLSRREIGPPVAVCRILVAAGGRRCLTSGLPRLLG